MLAAVHVGVHGPVVDQEAVARGAGAPLDDVELLRQCALSGETGACVDGVAASDDLAGVAARDLRTMQARSAAAETAGAGARVEAELRSFRTYVTGARAGRISVAGKTQLLRSLERWLPALDGLDLLLRDGRRPLPDRGGAVGAAQD